MSSKRKDASLEEKSGREKKKQRMADARTITFQEPTPSGSTQAGTSRIGLRVLPGALDVEKFSQARQFEIRAMHDAMQSSSDASTSRAWQELPRHLRRRAASHDVRRVPIRLRDKARAEMDAPSKKASNKQPSKRGAGKRVERTASLARRQSDKSWLETHIWHAKRMKMENMWGYRLAVTPTEKAFRPSHRAAVHGSILHDASYLGLIELKGVESTIDIVLSQCCDPSGPLKTLSNGSRACHTHIYQPGQFPLGLICPVTVLWRPVSEQDSASNNMRTLWIQCHPAPFSTVYAALHTSISDALEQLQAGSPTSAPVEGVEMADLRGRVNVFDIVGPRSSQVLHGALHPVSLNGDVQEVWPSLKNLSTPGSIAPGIIIGLSVRDPRLSFPPKNAQPTGPASVKVKPTGSLAQSDLWDIAASETQQGPKYKKQELDERRSKNLVPGTRLTPARNDDRVPILLIQKSLPGVSKGQTMYGWTLIVPSGWGMAFLPSLVFTGTRIGGQTQKQHQAFETGSLHFPHQYPCTAEYDEFNRARVKEEKAAWERKPPSKRPNFEKLGVEEPWDADWHALLGLRPPRTEENLDLISTQRDVLPLEAPAQAAMIEDEDEPPQPWFCLPSLLARVLPAGEQLDGVDVDRRLVAHVNELRVRRGQPPTPLDPHTLLSSALVSVRLTLCGRGAPKDMAMIHSVGDGEARTWWQQHKGSSGTVTPVGEDVDVDEVSNGMESRDGETPMEQKLSTTPASSESLIGRVLSGSFSLCRGRGFAMGCIPLARLVEMREQNSRNAQTSDPADCRSKVPLLVKLRDRDGRVCRLAELEY